MMLTCDSSLVSSYSEIRLVEIVEGLCDSSSFECNHMVEEHEELFETWWFKRCGVHAVVGMGGTTHT